jgi:hypothetical protein
LPLAWLRLAARSLLPYALRPRASFLMMLRPSGGTSTTCWNRRVVLSGSPEWESGAAARCGGPQGSCLR